MVCIDKEDQKEQKFYRDGTMKMNLRSAAEMESIKLRKIFKISEILSSSETNCLYKSFTDSELHFVHDFLLKIPSLTHLFNNLNK